MKHITRHPNFRKHYKKRIATNASLNARFRKRFLLFASGERGYPLNDHALTGKMAGKRSFSVSANIRIVYEETSDEIIFLDIGSHNQVY